MGYAIDKSGTKIFWGEGGPDKDNSDLLNAARMAEAAEKQNMLYEKELKETRRQNMITRCIAIISLLVSIAAMIIDLCKA